MVLAGVSCFSILLFFIESLNAETVFLKDGSIIEGRIIYDSAGTVAVKDKESKTRTIQRANIMRILYTDLYMGKVYVQKTDGKNIIAYMVDEDRDTYTFRRELFNPEEFKLRRDQVLFMARGNPSGLQGEADTDRVGLKWFPPYNQVKKYNVYIKGPEDKKFRLADVSKSLNFTVKKLNSNTKYYFYVTAIDSAGDESLPSNEFTVVTKNILPGAPADITLSKKISPDGKSFSVSVSWNEAVDPDGKIVSYEIWNMEGEGKPSGKVKERTYTISGLDSGKIYSFALRSVDDKGGFSEFEKFTVSLTMQWAGSVRGGIYFPGGDISDSADTGYGVFASLERRLPWISGAFAGVQTGCVYFPGAKTGVENLIMAPAEALISYKYEADHWIFGGIFSGGVTWSRLEYFYEKKINGSPDILVKNAFDPSGGAALFIYWAPFDRVMLGLITEFHAVYETGGMMNYYGGGLTCGYRF